MLKLNIQLFADGKVVIDTELNTKNFESGLDKIKNTTQKAGSTVKSIVAGLGITKAVSYAMGQITGSIDGAIARLDTLNNFPKVMNNLGIASDEAEQSIAKMSDKLAGLPTTLDQGASAVQRFTSKNGDVAKSTDLFLALNNAILAGGASSEIQASALEQLSQSYAKGKPDMMEWRTAMTAMPAQLKQVAQAMGYIDADELGEALRDGTESMDDFMDTIVLLNTEGVDGFLSFEKQARNSTGGIKTSITVAKTQVVKGVADIIKAFDVNLENTGFGSLGGLIAEVGKTAKIGLDEVAKVISGEISLYDFGKEITDFITRMINKFSEEFPRIANIGINLALELAKGILNPESVSNLVSAGINLVSTLANALVDNFEIIVDSGLEMVLALVQGISNGYPQLVEEADKILNKLLDKLTDQEFLNKLAEKGGEILVTLVIGMIRAIPKIVGLIGNLKGRIAYEFNDLPSKFFDIGINVVKGLWNGIQSRAGQLKKDVQGWANGILTSVKKTLKIASPSKRFRDEIGKQSARGFGVGFDDELSKVYNDIQRAINVEQAKLQANVETGRVFNTLQNSTPVAISIDADVEMDSQKVGRLVTPTVTKTIQTGGGV